MGAGPGNQHGEGAKGEWRRHEEGGKGKEG